MEKRNNSLLIQWDNIIYSLTNIYSYFDKGCRKNVHGSLTSAFQGESEEVHKMPWTQVWEC